MKFNLDEYFILRVTDYINPPKYTQFFKHQPRRNNTYSHLTVVFTDNFKVKLTKCATMKEVF